MFLMMALFAQQHQVRPVKRDRWVFDVIRCYPYLVMDFKRLLLRAGFYNATL
jgi:hypothetical protein